MAKIVETKNRRISINAMDSIMKTQYENITTECWNEIDITIKRTISLGDMLSFVNDVVASCFQDNGEFMPKVLDFAIRSNIILKYSNVSLPDNLEHRYAILYCTDIVNFIRGHADQEQVDEIINAIHRKVDYLCNTNVRAIQSKLNELISAFDNLQSKTADVFNNISSDDVAKLASILSSGELSEEKIVAAYMDRVKADAQEKADV